MKCNKLQQDQRILVKIDISPEERKLAKRLAKSLGMTFQGWSGQLIRRELRKENESSQVTESSVAGNSILGGLK